MNEQPSPPDAEIVPPPVEVRLQRIEESLAARPAVVPHAPTPSEEQLADRLLQIILAKTAEHRAGNGAGPTPPGLVPPEKMYGTVKQIPPEIGLPNSQSLWKFFVAGILGEIKIIARMYFDPRYRLSRVAQIGVPAILALYILNYFFFAYTCALPILPQLAERIMYIPLTLALYKVLVREVARYREVLAYLARYG
jgi:hypothetical protein